MTNLRATATCAAIGLLCACANPSGSSGLPGAAPAAQAPAANRAERPYTGRVLYVADIDGQPGVGQIHVYAADMKNGQELRTITSGTGRPFGLWVDAKNVLYVANEPNKYPASVTEFKPGASSPFFQITQFKGYPQSVAVDRKGNVYVNESYADDGIVQEFAPGSNSAERTIDTGIKGYAFTPGSMAFDPRGNLVVAEQAKLLLQIVKISAQSGKVTPIDLDLAGNNLDGPGMGIDKAGDIYVAGSSAGEVAVFAPRSTEPSRVISPVQAYGLTWVTPQGAVYQADGETAVTEIAPGSSSPTYTLSCQCSAQGAAVSR